ncbi:aldehyde dehydrogenase (NADP(+)) [Pollutimonas bauzanensis]|uniref:NADP-dependent aldehyde dehydrogenase n=1 Tax=Pollutimonas bauzanensis TaxID=658167 RepID=A0A1M5UNZ6_9BURK|nr:aldehyde dehydrogenase (NADP(+)) [Pollutimonas bauzanensis]SHH64792.1 NADP-dependent aldehyde dehydrogenase [Pollutimonas bauzanensis]
MNDIVSAPVLGHNYIGGQRSARGATAQQSIGADSGLAYPVSFHQATPEEIDEAVLAASRAYREYRTLSIERRADFLDQIAEEIDALGDDFIAEVSDETALPAGRLQGEKLRTSNQMRLFARVLRRGDFHGARIDTALPQRQPMPRPDIRLCRMGMGPVAVFGASNFPLAFSVAGGDTAAALAAGCPVVVKAHTGHMVTSERVADAIERARERCGIPAGVFNMIYGTGVGARLVQAPGIKAVGFTGSLKGGRALCDLAAARPDPIPVFAEMSSINPIVLLPGALQERGAAVARDLAASVSMGCGQLCTSPGLILGVQSPELSAFAEQLAGAFGAMPAQTMLNRGALDSYEAGLDRLKSLNGAEILASGATAAGKATAHVFKAKPALLLDNADAPLEEEVFGPSTVLVSFDSMAQMAAFLAGMHGQLTATIIATETEVAGQQALVSILEEKAGRLLLNGFPTGVEVCDAMVHGGPYPATSDARGTSVGSLAIDRYLRPVCYQNYPDALLPPALQNANPLGILRLVNGEPTRDPV